MSAKPRRSGLANHFGTLSAIENASMEALTGVPDVGEVVAESIYAFFREPHNRTVIDALIARGICWPAVEKTGAESGLRKNLCAHRHTADTEP